MAEVFLARQSGVEGFEKPVVIKRILPHLTTDPKFVEMFINEARVAARLSHPSIVQIFDLGKLDGQYFIAMEFIHGEDLRALAKAADEKRARPSMPMVARVIADMLAGLHYAHTRVGPDGKPLGLVHRDISPQNVLVTYEGGVKLVDFGIAKATESASSQQTQAGLLKGKYAYMSPEQCRSKKIDARSDIFSVGILLWELVSWQRLFRRDSDLATLVAVADEPIPPLASVRRDVPPELDRIAARALARNPAERYPTAQAMQADLEALIRRYAWEADSIALQRYMRGLFADKLHAQDEAVRAAGVGSLEDLLTRGDVDISWIEPVAQTQRTPAGLLQPSAIPTPAPEAFAPASPPVRPARRDPTPAPSQAMGPSPSQPLYIAPVPQPVRDGSEFTGSTLRNAVGQAVPARSSDRITSPTGAVAMPPPSRLKRALVVGGTSLVLAGAVLTAVLWPGGAPADGGDKAEAATIHLTLDSEAQIFVDGVRQLPGRETDLVVAAHKSHELRVRRGDHEKSVTVPALDVGAIENVSLKLN